ncbi:hypothetical protein CXF85_21100 [Colwellia sp. 75C3]|nr:hypothetical protein CXF85_21100 [Colwellia sp. 75C3]
MPKGVQMNNKFLIMILTLGISNIAFAEDKNYKGRVQLTLKEPSGSGFSSYTDFETSTNQKIISYFRRTSGQFTVVTNNGLHIDPSKMNKYRSSLNILEVNNDSFIASLKIHSNSMEYDSEKSKGTLISKVIVDHKIKGVLFGKNEYSYINKGMPNLFVEIDFDKVFTKEEIKERFNQQVYIKSLKQDNHLPPIKRTPKSN